MTAANPLALLGSVGLGDAVAEVAGRLERAGQLDPDTKAQLERLEMKLDWMIGTVLSVAGRHGKRLGLDPDTLARNLPASLHEIRAGERAQAAAAPRDPAPGGDDTPEPATGPTAPQTGLRFGLPASDPRG